MSPDQGGTYSFSQPYRQRKTKVLLLFFIFAIGQLWQPATCSVAFLGIILRQLTSSVCCRGSPGAHRILWELVGCRCCGWSRGATALSLRTILIFWSFAASSALDRVPSAWKEMLWLCEGIQLSPENNNPEQQELPPSTTPPASFFTQLQITYFCATCLSWVHKFLILLPVSDGQREQGPLNGALWPWHSLLNCITIGVRLRLSLLPPE